MKRPTIKSPCIADHYHNKHQRIAEVHGPLSGFGCLISASEHQDDNGDWYLDVTIYRADGHDEHVQARVKCMRPRS